MGCGASKAVDVADAPTLKTSAMADAPTLKASAMTATSPCKMNTSDPADAKLIGGANIITFVNTSNSKSSTSNDVVVKDTDTSHANNSVCLLPSIDCQKCMTYLLVLRATQISFLPPSPCSEQLHSCE